MISVLTMNVSIKEKNIEMMSVPQFHSSTTSHLETRRGEEEDEKYFLEKNHFTSEQNISMSQECSVSSVLSVGSLQ